MGEETSPFASKCSSTPGQRVGGFVATLPSICFLHGGIFSRALGSFWVMLVPFQYPFGTFFDVFGILLVPFWHPLGTLVLPFYNCLASLLDTPWFLRISIRMFLSPFRAHPPSHPVIHWHAVQSHHLYTHPPIPPTRRPPVFGIFRHCVHIYLHMYLGSTLPDTRT